MSVLVGNCVVLGFILVCFLIYGGRKGFYYDVI